MQYKGYNASMDFDTEDQVIVGRVPGIDDIIAFHAKTEAEFQSNFHEAVDAYLAASIAIDSRVEQSAATANLPMKTSAKSTT